MNEKYKISCYRILYRFLKEYGLMPSYLSNMVQAGHPKSNAKVMLKQLIEDFIATTDGYGTVDCQSIFSWVPSSFSWNTSHEGEIFWYDGYRKWISFYYKHKEEYNFR